MTRSLLIAPIYAASVMAGGGQRTFHLYRALARLGHVDVLLVSEDACAPYEEALDRLRDQFRLAGKVTVQRSTAQFLQAPHGSRRVWEKGLYLARRLLRQLESRAAFFRPTPAAARALELSIASERYEVLVGRYLQCAALAGAFAQKTVPVIVDLDDLEEKVLESRILAPDTSPLRRWLLRRHLLETKRIVEQLRVEAAHVFTASAADLSVVASRSSSVLANVPYVPDGKEWPVLQPSPPHSRDVLFVGSFGHRVNRDGLAHFIANCWPMIRARVPDARLRVVGSGGWEEARGSLEASDGVVVVGATEDLGKEYARAAFCVVPVFEGSGTKIKVVEALMYGRAVAASRHSVHGYDDLAGKGLCSAATLEDLAAICIDLFLSPEKRDAGAAIGYEFVKAHYSESAVFRCVEKALLHSRLVGERAV